MTETVRLLDESLASNPAMAPWPSGSRIGRRIRAVGMAMLLLLLPSLYILGRPSYLPVHHQHLLQDGDAVQLSSFAPQLLVDQVPSGYLVWSHRCKIPDIDPHAKDAMDMFHAKKYEPCTNEQIFTHLDHDINGRGVLHVNITLLKSKNTKHQQTTCCYYNITRPVDPKYADAKIVRSSCLDFNNSVTLLNTEEFIVAKCTIKNSNKRNSKAVYEDAHSNIHPTEDIKRRFENFKANYTQKTWNVLMIGIDTLSRINLARAMPKTNRYLKRNGWLDFQGYNKMDDNTYPNLMAILTGRNQSSARKACDGSGINSPDNCDFMWKQYQNVGYVSAYAEDYIGIDTFGKPLHKGFTVPPADHYLRPLYMAVEKTVKSRNGDRFHCSGQTTSGELLFSYALNFVKKYADDPFFGFFWSNTFSHDDVSSPSSMDEKVVDFFTSLKASGALNSTIVWFISDHGIRFGKLRSLLSGYYEERLPSLFVWLPESFKELHPQAHRGMLINTKRLTSPYDVHMTLQDILLLSGRKSDLDISEGCPLCQSLFQPVSYNRSCDESSLQPHWCTCNLLRPLPLTHKMALKVVNFVINVEIEKTLDLVNTDKCRVCAKLTLQKVIYLYVYDYVQPSDNFTDYLSVFSTQPGTMMFEATVRHFESGKLEIQGIVSRLTAYRGGGGCVKTAHLKKYCYCIKCKPKF